MTGIYARLQKVKPASVAAEGRKTIISSNFIKMTLCELLCEEVQQRADIRFIDMCECGNNSYSGVTVEDLTASA